MDSLVLRLCHSNRDPAISPTIALLFALHFQSLSFLLATFRTMINRALFLMSTMHKEECQQVHPFSNKKKAMFLQQWKVRIFPGTHQGSSLSRCVRLSLQSEPGHHHIQQENQSLPENLHATNNMDFKHVISQPSHLNQSHFALL